MKTNIIRASILPLIFILAIAAQPQKNGERGDKAQKEENKQSPSNKDNQGRGNGAFSRGNSEGNRGNGQENKKDGPNNQGRSGEFKRNTMEKGNNPNLSDARSESRSDTKDLTNHKNNGKDRDSRKGYSQREIIRWNSDNNISWGFEDYANRKRPNNIKKVNICHNTGDGNYPVSISVSENAMKAHLNHGDQIGDCGNGYTNRWPAKYTRTRENVYNTYENTWETMSYTEALIRFAAERLLGIKNSFQNQRQHLDAQEIQRKEVLIMELENNINSLENQLKVTRQKTDGININITL
jgi:hypothetical protein